MSSTIPLAVPVIVLQPAWEKQRNIKINTVQIFFMMIIYYFLFDFVYNFENKYNIGWSLNLILNNICNFLTLFYI